MKKLQKEQFEAIEVMSNASTVAYMALHLTELLEELPEEFSKSKDTFEKFEETFVKEAEASMKKYVED